MDDQTPELEGASGGAEDLELELEVIPKEPSGDPLDNIQDETARAEAKKWRSIARRSEKEKSEVKPIETKTNASSTEFLTKADFHKANERKAILQTMEDPEIKAHWKEIVPFYTPRRGKETPEDISEDIKDAIILYKARNPVVDVDDSANALSASTVVKSGGGKSDAQIPKVKDPPNFKLPTQPKDWYQMK